MLLKATDIRRGMVITMDGVNFVVVDFAHHTPGNLRAMVQTKLRNMNNGSLIDKRLRSVDQIEVPFVETKEYEYLYSAGDEHVFMDTETYDQLHFCEDIIGTAMQYLLPNTKVMVKYINDKAVSIEIPDSVELTVTDTPPALCRGDRHQPVQGSDPRDRPEGPGSAVHQAGREDPDRHPHRRVPGTRQVSAGEARSVDDLTRLLGDLVSIPSVNPMGRTLSGPELLETRLSGYLEDWFPDQGSRASASRSRRVATTCWPGSTRPGSRRTLLFDVHQDTVPTDGMTIAPFEPRVEGGRLYGRGSCDVKGGMAAMLMAVARLCREQPRHAASVVLACTVDEEFTHTGSSQLAETGHGADLAIVAEPTLLNLVHCHKGALRWKIRTTGRGLPQLDPAARGQRHLPDGPRPRAP